MRFNPKARLDTSRTSDGGGGGMGGGMGGGPMRLPIPGGTAGGGGLGMVVLIVLFFVVTQCMGGGSGLPGGLPAPDNTTDTSRVAPEDSGRYDQCKTGA
ncbi:MAG: peptidase, partial [Nocardioides sp.]